MIYRSVAIGVLITAAIFLVSCSSSSNLSSISVTPATASIGTVGGTTQFVATGTYVRNGHPSTTQNITSSVTWTSSSTDVATINSAGVATAVGNGTTSITATMTSSVGAVAGTASLTVTTGGAGGERELTVITMIPGSQTLNAIGASAQFIVTGTYSAPPTTENLAGQVTWASSATDVATINSSGLATAVGCGSSSCATTITASATSLSGSIVVGQATLTVSPGSAPQQRTLSAINIVPGAGTQTLETLGETAQFIAIGTYTASPTTVDMTDTVAWASSDVDIATIDSSGLATAVGCGGASCSTVITANAQAQDGSLIVGASNLTVNPGTGGTGLPSLSVYLVGAGTGTVTSTPAGINCNGSGAGCTAYFPLGSSVTLTATPAGFGGWSANCTPKTTSPCAVTMNTNQTVGAIFN
jgi:trimeric autotransporter adhesin